MWRTVSPFRALSHNHTDMKELIGFTGGDVRLRHNMNYTQSIDKVINTAVISNIGADILLQHVNHIFDRIAVFENA